MSCSIIDHPPLIHDHEASETEQSFNPGTPRTRPAWRSPPVSNAKMVYYGTGRDLGLTPGLLKVISL